MAGRVVFSVNRPSPCTNINTGEFSNVRHLPTGRFLFAPFSVFPRTTASGLMDEVKESESAMFGDNIDE